jgi:hypothetical protein
MSLRREAKLTNLQPTNASQETWKSEILGPKHGEWQVGFMHTADQGIWSQCGKADMLNVKIQAQFSKDSKSPGLFLANWTVLSLKWRLCSSPPMKGEL